MSRDPSVAAAEGARGRRVPFGGQDVDEAEKAGLVGAIFATVAPRYDLMNDLMSGGIHRLWKRQMVDRLGAPLPARVLDLAGGTGDIALRVLDRAQASEDCTVIVCDINPAMLEVGRDRAWDRGWIRRPAWLCADGESLPLADSSFEACTIAFGIRNFTHIDRALAEIARVLRPGGRFLCLEFTPEISAPLRPAYDLFSHHVIPAIGEAVVGDGDAYRYLVESIRRFPDPDRFAAMIGAAGFAGIRVRRLAGGIAALHTAWRT
ncbi:MAG: class I SAM-dependent methyltransferase [Alphaproteobacteria bacterium]|nr:class I SAM-dependent methyltransferase [Alphaproteobacteria bacterium]